MKFDKVKKIDEKINGPNASRAMELIGRKIRVKKEQTVIYWDGYPFKINPPPKIPAGEYTIGNTARYGPEPKYISIYYSCSDDGRPIRFFLKEYKGNYYGHNHSIFLYFFQFELLGMTAEKLHEEIREMKNYLTGQRMSLNHAKYLVEKGERKINNWEEQLKILNGTNNSTVKGKSYIDKYKTLIELY